jgi:hypothetical protein
MAEYNVKYTKICENDMNIRICDEYINEYIHSEMNKYTACKYTGIVVPAL